MAVHAPAHCPVVAAAGTTGERVTDVSWTRPRDGDGGVVEEFRVPTAEADAVPEGADPVLDVDDRRVFRVERERTDNCVCELVEGLGYPVDSVHAVDERLLITLHLPDLDALRDVVGDLGAVSDHVEVQYLVHDRAEDDGESPVVVDRDRLTDRQREVLRTALEMGYFEYPRDANATAVAEALDIDLSTFTEHLAVAQSKLLDGVLSA